MGAMANKQRGVSFSGFLTVAVLLVLAVIGGMRLVPPYMEHASIQKIFDTIAHDPEMQNAQISDIRMSYSKRASVDYIKAINASDIDIGKDASGISLSASYSVKQPLFGNVSLLIDFNVSSASK